MIEEKYIEKINKKIDQEYLDLVKEILESEIFLSRKNFNHHENRSVYSHSLMVSIISYKIAKKIKADYKSAALGGLLHDFYYEDWQQNNKKTPLFKKHGFVHAREAVDNSNIHFPLIMNSKIENIIKRHMFPLNITPPRYFESWIIMVVDKYVSLEIFLKPKGLLKYVGIKKQRKEV